MYSNIEVQKNIRKNPNPRRIVLNNKDITPLFLKALKLNAVPYYTEYSNDEQTIFYFNISRITRAIYILGKHINFGKMPYEEILMDQ